MFITLEGGEGSGKTTLLHSLCAYFRDNKKSVGITREPGSPFTSNIFRDQILSGQVKDKKAQLYLFLADRALHLSSFLTKSQSKFDIVISDRYYHSTVAYQHEVAERTKLYEMALFSCSNLLPNLTFYLDIDPEKGLQRAFNRLDSSDAIESKSLLYHQQVRKEFLKCSDDSPSPFFVIDASVGKEDLLSAVIHIIEKYSDTSL